MAKKAGTLVEQRAQVTPALMKKHFDNCPWTELFLPLRPGGYGEDEESTDYDYVEAGINGIIYAIRRGVSVEVPVPIYEDFVNAGKRFGIGARHQMA